MPSNPSQKLGARGFHAIVLQGLCRTKDCRGAVKSITELNRSPTLLCQAVRAELVAGREHALHASRLALNAILDGENRSRKKELEFLLWLSGKRQLDKAISAFGLRGGKGEAVFVVAVSLKSAAEAKSAAEKISRALKLEKTVEKGARSAAETAKLTEFFGITPKMLECFPTARGREREGAVEKLVLEKIALLALEG